MSETPDAPDIKGALSKKVGPLPVGAWLAAIGGGLAISFYLRRHPSTAAPATSTDPGTVETVAPGYAATGGTGGAAVSWPGNISGPVDTGDTVGTTEPVAITSNAIWRQQAVKWLVGNGVGAIAAEQAVGNYLAGGALSLAQAESINKAVAAIGPTPDAVPTISVTGPTPPPEPTPTPAPGPPPGPAPITTNGQWRGVAFDYMIHHGHTGVASGNALDNYLAGRDITDSAKKAINEAIRAIGPPPQPIPKPRKDKGKHTNPGR